MARIDYYFAVLSPFTYLAGDELERIAAKHNAEIAYYPVDIMALFAATGGTAPKDRHPNRQVYRVQELARIAKHRGAPINLKPAHWPTNPVPASVALYAAMRAGHDVGPLAQAIVRAVWAEEKDIADAETLDGIIAECGIDKASLAPHQADAESDWAQATQKAIDAGAFGAPFYIVGDERFWGQDRLAYLDAHLSEIA